MSKKDFFDLENQIKETVKSAFEAIDFATLKNDVHVKAESKINEVKSNLENKSQQLNEKIKSKRDILRSKLSNEIKKEDKQIQRYICKRPVGSISGMLYMIFGSIGSGVLGVLLIVYSILTSFSNGYSQMNYIGLGIMLSFFAGSVGLTLRGRYLRRRVKRFRQYVTCLEQKNYCTIEELSELIGAKSKFVIKDLRKMIELDMFPQGRINDKQTYFMLNQEVYENYLSSEQSFKQRKEEELRRQEMSEREMNDPEKQQLKSVIEMGENYVKQIKSIKESTLEKEISAKLNKLENIVIQILKYVEKNPKKLSEVNKFTNHYLPITLKLVNSYKELNNQPVQGDNIKSAKNEIEKSIDLINIAFEKLLDDLFEEVALDISTDISVLETLFTQEGLTKKDFEK